MLGVWRRGTGGRAWKGDSGGRRKNSSRTFFIHQLNIHSSITRGTFNTIQETRYQQVTSDHQAVSRVYAHHIVFKFRSVNWRFKFRRSVGKILLVSWIGSSLVQSTRACFLFFTKLLFFLFIISCHQELSSLSFDCDSCLVTHWLYLVSVSTISWFLCFMILFFLSDWFIFFIILFRLLLAASIGFAIKRLINTITTW